MGLTVCVGLFADRRAEAGDDPEEQEAIDGPLAALNRVLISNKLPPHAEPLDLPVEDRFEAQMLGYNGLHALRRLAVYHASGLGLPEQLAYGEDGNDPVYSEYNDRAFRAFVSAERKGILGWFKKAPAPQPFCHLLLHSDAEGFYVPQDFAPVLIDPYGSPELGMMVGSAVRLLQECRDLAALLQVPEALDVESDEFLEFLDNPPATGAIWTMYPISTHSVVNLIRACKAALTCQAVVQFT